MFLTDRNSTLRFEMTEANRGDDKLVEEEEDQSERQNHLVDAILLLCIVSLKNVGGHGSLQLTFFCSSSQCLPFYYSSHYRFWHQFLYRLFFREHAFSLSPYCLLHVLWVIHSLSLLRKFKCHVYFWYKWPILFPFSGKKSYLITHPVHDVNRIFL